MGVVSLLILAVPLLALYLLWRYSYWYRRGVPQGNPLKLFGSLNDITITTLPYAKHYLKLARKFYNKPFYGVYSMSCPILVVRNADMIKDVLTKQYNSFASNGFEISEDVDPIISRDPFFQPHGDRWKETRNSFSSLMTPGRLRAMMPEITEACKGTIKYLRDLKHESGKSDGANIKSIGSRTMTSLLIRLTVSLDAGCFKPGENPFLEAEKTLFEHLITGYTTTILMVIAPKLGHLLGIRFVPQKVIDFYTKVIREQVQYRKTNGITRNDILDTIMKKAYDANLNGVGTKEGAVLDKDSAEIDVIAVIIMFIVEGFETTSTNVATAIAELARNPDLQETLRQQILTQCPLGTDINEEAVNNLPLLQNCLLEALRIYPPAMWLQRIVTQAVTLEADTGEKVRLEKGTKVFLPIFTLQRDSEYFPDPEKFDPYRLEDENQKRRLLGFGDGLRQCPGQRFALLASKVLLAMILREFKLELSPKAPMPLEPVNHAVLFSLNEVLVRFVPA